jgi:hypothetical protein
MKNINYLLLLLPLVVLLAGCTTTKTPKDIASERFQNNKEVASNELANRYQAIVDWDSGLKYTSQIQERLIQDKPILFEGDVKDIMNRDGKSFITFSNIDYINILELESTKEVADNIIADDSDYSFFNKYIIIAKITEILEPVSSSDNGCDSVSSPFYDDIKKIPCVNLVTGLLVDAIYINDK